VNNLPLFTGPEEGAFGVNGVAGFVLRDVVPTEMTAGPYRKGLDQQSSIAFLATKCEAEVRFVHQPSTARPMVILMLSVSI